MSLPDSDPPMPTPDRPVNEVSATGLTKREYFAAHLFGPVTANLSQYCTMQDRAQHAVDAADALIQALDRTKPAS